MTRLPFVLEDMAAEIARVAPLAGRIVVSLHPETYAVVEREVRDHFAEQMTTDPKASGKVSGFVLGNVNVRPAW